jgi:hypothetical protein
MKQVDGGSLSRPWRKFEGRAKDAGDFFADVESA